MAMMRYAVVLDPNEGTDVFTATVPALPGCITQGHGIDEALAIAREASTGHPEAMATLGDRLPRDDAVAVRTVELDLPTTGVA